MGGRGSNSGKKGGSGVKKEDVTQLKQRKSSANGKATQNRTYEKPSTPINKMSDANLRRELIKATKVYYASGKSGISFGGMNTDVAAEMLGSRKMSRIMMEKQYRNILKRL